MSLLHEDNFATLPQLTLARQPHITRDGLQQAAVVDHTDVPLGPLSCFSAAIDTVDWSGVTSEPVEITFPFQIAPEDP